MVPLTFFLCSLLLSISHAYKAAVIEHHSIIPQKTIRTVSDAEDVMNANLDKLEPNIINATKQGADIVLLSEMAITSLIKVRETMNLFLYELGAVKQGMNSTACDNPSFNDRPVLQRISCLAQKNTVYLAVNWGDIVPCHRVTDKDCPLDGHYQYNTEIVFDSNGQMIAKYWKIHTFTATEFDTPKEHIGQKYEYFELDDGTKIGIITCFDSMYATPLLPLIHEEGISNFIVSHWWNNQYAMFSAASWWQALSRRMEINLMTAATWVTPTTDQVPWSSGSGIYSSGNILASWYNQKRLTIDKLLVANVPKSNGPATDLPNFGGYVSLPQVPAPMCYDSMEWDHIEVGRTYHGSVHCPPFTCSVEFKVEKLDPERKEHWFLYTDTGYYFQADGNNAYYEEEFCTFYKCYDGSGCLTTKGHTADDTGKTEFDFIRVSGNYLRDSVTMAMSSGGDGDVYKDIMKKVKISESHGVTTADASDIHDVLINLSLIGRQYKLDAIVDTE